MVRERPVVHLHIGAMKTGTTHLQELMTVNAEPLRSAGYLFPLSDGRYSQTLATRDVLNMTGDPVTLQKSRGEWDRTVKEMLEFDGEASVFSMEFLSFARRRTAGKVVDSFDGSDVRAILTVRDAGSAIPAQWQQAMQSQRTTSWQDFVEQIMATPPDYGTWGARTFRRAQNVPRMLKAWLDHIPPEKFTVITVPRPGSPRTLLWERFAETIGVDPAVAKRPPPKSNESIGAASAELLRRLNERLTDIPISDYRGIMRFNLSNRILSDRVSTEGKAPTNKALSEFAAATNARTRDAIESCGVNLVGDLDDLPTAVSSTETGDLAGPSDASVVEAAAYAFPEMLKIAEKRAKQLRKTQKVSVRGILADLPQGSREASVLARWQATSNPAQAAVVDLAEVCRVAIDLSCRIREARDADPTSVTRS